MLTWFACTLCSPQVSILLFAYATADPLFTFSYYPVFPDNYWQYDIMQMSICIMFWRHYLGGKYGKYR